MDVQRISQLVENDNVFTCHGISTLTVTRMVKGEPKKVKVQVPIKTTGLDEYRRTIQGEAPKPPVAIKRYKKGSKEAGLYGVDKDIEVTTFDFTDKEYIDRNNEYVREFTYKLAVFAVDCDLTMADGTPAVSYEDKKRVLLSTGITGKHLDSILADVNALTEVVEDRENFLSKSLSDSTSPL